MHQTEKSMICTILGRSVNELPYGMDEEYADCLALKTNLAYQIHNLYLDGVTNFLCTCADVGSRNRIDDAAVSSENGAACDCTV